MNKKVAYVYSPQIENYSFGPDHPMKPKKVAITHDIIEKNGLLEKMDIYSPPLVSKKHLLSYHSSEYLDYMRDYFD